jgi:hypothetical protein
MHDRTAKARFATMICFDLPVPLPDLIPGDGFDAPFSKAGKDVGHPGRGPKAAAMTRREAGGEWGFPSFSRSRLGQKEVLP